MLSYTSYTTYHLLAKGVPMTTYPKGYSFNEWDEILGTRNSRKVANNTYAERIGADTIGIRLHNTYIVEYHRDRSIIINDGGYRTVTTKARINDFIPTTWRVFQQDWEWYVTGRQAGSCLYRSGMDLTCI